MLQDLKTQQVPIDGVGWQMHQVDGFRIQSSNQANARRLADLGLEISITEMDVRINLPSTSEKLAQQADAFRDAIDFCLTQPNCKALLMWGFTDKYSWVPGTFAGWGDALIYDANYQAKPAYSALQRSLQQGLNLSPRIIGASISGKRLLVAGELFEVGADLFINGEKQRKVSNDSENPGTGLVAKKSGARVRSGDVFQIRNPDGLLSNEFTYP